MGTPRKRLSSEQPAEIGAFAVMRHKADLKACHFVCLHDTHESAMNEAKRLTTVTIEQFGADLQPFCFYVVEFVGRVGIINGALQASH